MSTSDIVTIILALIGSGIVVTIGGYRIGVGVSNSVQPLVDQVNMLTNTMGAMNIELMTHEDALNSLTPTTDINQLAGNIYDSTGQLVFGATGPTGYVDPTGEA